jgi:hypothetical protein
VITGDEQKQEVVENSGWAHFQSSLRFDGLEMWLTCQKNTGGFEVQLTSG